MRLYLKLTRNKELIPFNYQSYLTGAIHKWIGMNNAEHDALSLYSFSWLQNAEAKGAGLNLSRDAYFFISAYNEDLIKKILKGIMVDASVCYGSFVSDVEISENPVFPKTQRFFTGSPVFIKRKMDKEEKHLTYKDENSGQSLTETLKKRLDAAGISSDGVKAGFDMEYSNPQTKIIRYKEIGNRVSICPVLIEGTPEQIAFAWNVGVGNSTGIGFGSLK